MGLDEWAERTNDEGMTVAAIHPFEKAGLGLGPFRVVGWYESKYQACHGAPIQPGSSCDYCSTGIMLVFRIKSADGKEFKVGCDCVAKASRECAGTDAERAARKVVDQVNRIKTAAANARKDEQIKAAKSAFEASRERLAGAMIEVRGSQRDAVEYLDWMSTRAGRAGKVRAAKHLETLLAAGR